MSMLHHSSIGTLFKALLITALLAAPAALCAADNAPAPATKQPSVDELIARNIEAHGGLAKMKAVQSVRMTGKMTMGQGMEAPMTLELKRPKNMRMEFTFQGMTGIQAYDGKDGWQVMPFMGSKDPEPMTTEDLQEAEEQADMDGPLVDYKAKGYKVELLGKEKIEGSDAWKLKVTMKTGERIIYLDADTMLEIKTEGKRTVRGSE
ncbi:MAG TPA: outer membrane lipoprotein-sorting protein, partial [Candidatus Polarisedimenticolia bacterium]|nr:outer membrane lipoprotein-sorting protein [Candidatus Polarisedimenticolia bacterium]